jgi:DNA helicase-2/ATP-dependent DNA helicase PcrA
MIVVDSISFSSVTLADFVVDVIKERLGSGDYDSTKDVALIYRTNAQSRALEEACVKASLPYVIFGSATSFYKRQEIKDTLCFLRWVNNGYDKSSMLRAMVTPKRGIGDAALNEFDAFCSESQLQWKDVSSDPGPSPLDVLLSLSGPTKFDEKMSFDPTGILSSRSLKPLSAFSQQIRLICDEARQKPVEKLLGTIESELNLFEHFDKISKSKSEFLERKANFEELQNAARKYSDDGPALGKRNGETTDGALSTPLGNFLDDVALVTDVLDAAKDGDNDSFVVKLMTIHASKGMEFDTVFLVGNEDGTLPTAQVS